MDPGSDLDISRRIYLLYFISAIGILTLVPLGAVALVQGNQTLGTVDIILALVLSGNLLHAHRYKDYRYNIMFGVTLTAIFLIYAFLTGGTNRSAFVWYYTFPLIASFLLGSRRGFAASLLMLAPVIWLFTGVSHAPYLADYHPDFKIRFVLSYLVVLLFSYLAEVSRERNSRSLKAARDEMEDRVRERTAELQKVNRSLEEEMAVKERAQKDLSEQVQLLALNADVGKALTLQEKLPAILQRCCDAIVDHLDAAFARIWTINTEGTMLELRASSGMYTHLDGEHGTVPVGEFKIGEIAAGGKPVLTNSVIGDPNISDQEWARREKMVSFAGHPLQLSGRTIGVMALFSRKELSDSALKALGSISDQIAIGIDRTLAGERLVHSENYLRSIILNEPECVKITSEDGTIIEMNPAGIRMLEADSPEQIIGKSIYSVISPAHKGDFRALVEKTCRGEKCSMEFKVTGLKGSELWLESYMVPFEDSRHEGPLVLAVTRDITSRRMTEEALVKAKEDLEEQNLELRKLDRMKDGLIRDVSHELKTPVAKHVMQLEILRPLTRSEHLSHEEQRAFAVMDESIRRQESVIRNLLDLSRLESGGRKYTKSEVRLDRIFDRLLEDYPGRISISAERSGDEILIRFVDNGIGLEPEDREKVFSRFYQASASHEGSGVGLTICKKIVEGLGGRVWLDSDGRNRGVTVTVALPEDH
jgi:PAS domain S-box-containing protein